MATKPTNDKQIFYQYMLNTLSWADFNTLPQQLGETKSLTTRRLNDPRAMELKMVKKIAQILDREVIELINEFELGLDGITAGQYRALQKEQQK